MQSITLPTAGTFADSTTVKAYLRSQVPDQRRAPIGAAVSEGTTASGSVTIPSLEEGKAYRVGAEVSSKWVFIDVVAPSPTEGGFSTVVAANTVTLPGTNTVEVTGTTEVKKITAALAGRLVRLIFKESVKVVKGENLKLTGNFEATALDTLTLASDGTNWYEIGRAANS